MFNVGKMQLAVTKPSHICIPNVGTTTSKCSLCEDLHRQWMQLSSVRTCADCGTQGVAGVDGVGWSLADFTHLLLRALSSHLGSHVLWRPWIVRAMCHRGRMLWCSMGMVGCEGCVQQRQCVAGVANCGGHVPRQLAWGLG